MKFIAVTISNKKVILNADRIAWMEPHSLGSGTKIWFGGTDDDYIRVEESLQQVEDLCFTDWRRLPRE